MLDEVHAMAAEQGATDRLVAVHCDLGRMEWAGTKALAQEQCDRYKLPLHVVSRPEGDVLTRVEERGMRPDSKNRYCTSDHERGQVLTMRPDLVAGSVRRRSGRTQMRTKRHRRCSPTIFMNAVLYCDAQQ